jgi:hypothetical protein
MNQTIKDMRINYVFSPKLPSYSAPHAQVKILCQQSYDQGWNACMAHLKGAGKIWKSLY